MSNLDWFRLWTMEHEKGSHAGGAGQDSGSSHGSGEPQYGSGLAYGPEYHDDAPSGYFPFFGGQAQHHDDGRDGLMPVDHDGGIGGIGGIGGHGGYGGYGGADSYDAILFGHLDAGGLHAGFGPGTLVVIPIEHLEINQNTLIQNTNILFDAHGGGSVAVGGDVTAISSQTGLIDHAPELQPIAA